MPVMLLSPLATILTGKILADQVLTVRLIKQLQEATQNLNITLQSIGDAVISTDIEGKIQIMNPMAEKLTGWSFNDAKNRQLTEIFNIVNAKTHLPAENPVNQVLAKKILVGLANHTVLISRNGTEYQIADSAAPVCDAKGNTKGVVMVFRDVTENYRQVEELRQNEALFRKLFKDHAAVKLITDPDTKKIIAANCAAEKFYGWSREQLMHMTIDQIDTAPSKTLAAEFKRARRLSQIQFEFCHRLADGSIRDVEIFSSKIRVKGKELLHAIIHDITERKQAEMALLQSENRYRNIIMHSPNAILVNHNDRVTLVNHTCEQLFGAESANELIGKTVYELFHADYHELIRERIRHLRKKQKSVPLMEEQIVRLDGRVVDVDVMAAPFTMDKTIYIHVILRDITQRKQKRTELQHLYAAIEQSDEMIVITDIVGHMVYVNAAFERVTGYSREEALGENPRILKSGEQSPACYTKLWETITKGKTWKGQLINKRKNGTFYSEKTSISPVMDESGRIINFVAVKRDITEEIELQKRLVQAQKMEAIGTLSSGIAHDFNNLLFPILGLSEIMLEDLPPGSMDREHIEQIYKAGIRASDLVKQILSFSRQVAQKKIPIRVQSVLKEIIKLSRSTIPANIKITQNIQADCPMVLMDASQLHQVAMNLITNAYHAVEEKGGSIFLGLIEYESKNNDLKHPSLPDGKYAMITVKDTGYGIPPSLIEKIFEPFYTTKKQGKGTGLGLSVVYGIVKDAGGVIDVQSEIDSGTTFNLFIPILEDGQNELPENVADTISRGNERILLVDDEPAVMQIEKQLLERLGYHVETRSCGLEALEAFRMNPERFDLVLTDMAMPNLTGEELAEEINSIDANIPIIICTGFSDRIKKETVSKRTIRGILMKPVMKSEMAKTIRRVLDEKDGKI
ncbi:hypothetical protein DSCOOX_22190 [Desulfosarcina ovata subsp. ovata]|uniref:histidine kinase n=1 Tax=Desulfosarcina ovata subsp. ovata TaxID=2752305 RepID=A0A5K8A992_9BACT|nr:hypothetical protein DSCOOX_22190 [Desulfosarcina ovata subsp. ovata]